MARTFNGEYEMDPNGINRVIEEYGNTMIALRMVRWQSDKEFKLDLRKYRFDEEGEKYSKGISFSTEDGPSELAKVLLEEGYGDDKEVAESLYKTRPAICNNIMDLMNGVKLEVPNNSGLDILYDPRETLFDDEEE